MSNRGTRHGGWCWRGAIAILRGYSSKTYGRRGTAAGGSSPWAGAASGSGQTFSRIFTVCCTGGELGTHRRLVWTMPANMLIIEGRHVFVRSAQKHGPPPQFCLADFTILEP